jgi:hypothetical protein
VSKLYGKCPVCGGSGEKPDLPWSGSPACPGCRGERFVEIGLTLGQVERMAKLELATARACFGDSGIDGPDRYIVKRPDGTVERFAGLETALPAFNQIWRGP